jgi:hypothetical protein
MAETKYIYTRANSGLSLFVTVMRERDGHYLDSLTGTFKAFSSQSYNEMTPLATMPEIYYLSESRAVWTNGRYLVACHRSDGDSYVINGDPGMLEILDDVDIGFGAIKSQADSISDAIEDLATLTLNVGQGTVAVNHDTGGTNALAYLTSTGSGISGGDIIAFTKADYDAGNRSQEYVRGSTTTDVNGQWVHDLYLDPAVYTIVFKKDGVYVPTTQEVTVA